MSATEKHLAGLLGGPAGWHEGSREACADPECARESAAYDAFARGERNLPPPSPEMVRLMQRRDEIMAEDPETAWLAELLDNEDAAPDRDTVLMARAERWKAEDGRWCFQHPALPGEVFRDIDGDAARAALLERLRETVYVAHYGLNGSGGEANGLDGCTGLVFHEGPMIRCRRYQVPQIRAGMESGAVGSTREAARAAAKARCLRDLADKIEQGRIGYWTLRRVTLVFPDMDM
jgi:hypothetical protein